MSSCKYFKLKPQIKYTGKNKWDGTHVKKMHIIHDAMLREETILQTCELFARVNFGALRRLNSVPLNQAIQVIKAR